MALPQGILRFPGIDQVLQWSFTLSHGVTPSVAQVTIAPQSGEISDIGPMQIQFDGDYIQFDDCAVDSASLYRDPSSGMICSLSIQDRRWRWKFGEISGRYNIRKKDGTVEEASKKSPQAMARLLLNAMGEQNYSVAQLPNETLPERTWVYANPARELQSLCEELGCRVVLKLDGSVIIEVSGVGNDLPDLLSQRTRNFGVDPPNRPDTVKLVCGKTRWQTLFELEAVGQEPDTVANGIKIKSGEYKLLDDLSYRPSGGWGSTFPGAFGNLVSATTGVTDAEVQHRALQSVYLKYRIKSSGNGLSTFDIPGVNFSVDERWQVLPLESGCIETYLEDDIETPLPPRLDGLWFDNSADGANLPATRTYKKPFTVDTERGIVTLSEPLVRFSAGTVSPAKLFLTIAHSVKDPETGIEARETFEATVPGQAVGTGPMIIRRDDMQRTIIGQYSVYGAAGAFPSGSTPVANYPQIQQEAWYYLNATIAGFTPRPTDQAEWAGIVSINPDGAIQQVTWSGGPQGCITRASRNCEIDPNVPSYNERKQMLELKALSLQSRKLRQLADAATTAQGAAR